MKTKRRHNRRRKRRRTRRHRRRRTRRRKTRRRRGAGNGMTSGEAALVARPEFKKIANAVILKWNNKGFYPVTKLTDAQIKKLGQQTARRVLKAMGGPDNTNVADGIAGAYQMLAKGILKMQTNTIQSLIDNLNRRSVATATARAAALPTAAALNAGGGGGGGDGGGEAIYDTPTEDVAALFAASDLAAAMPVTPPTAPVVAAPTATAERVAIAIPRETTGGRRRSRRKHRSY